MSTITYLPAITTDRFVATDNGTYWFVADTHAVDANGTARVKSIEQVRNWAKGIEDSTIEWDSQYFPKSGITRDGKYKLTKVDAGNWEITRSESPDAPSVIAVDERTAQLYLRELRLYWVDQAINLGIGSKFTAQDPSDGVLRTEVVTEKINWADNSSEVRGHLGGRRMLAYPSGDICF